MVPPAATKVIFLVRSSFNTLRKSKSAVLSQGIPISSTLTILYYKIDITYIENIQSELVT